MAIIIEANLCHKTLSEYKKLWSLFNRRCPSEQEHQLSEMIAPKKAKLDEKGTESVASGNTVSSQKHFMVAEL